MKKVIKSFSSLSPLIQKEVQNEYFDSDSKKYPIIYQGKQEKGIVFEHDYVIYLIPVSTIFSEEVIDVENDFDDDVMMDFDNEG